MAPQVAVEITASPVPPLQLEAIYRAEAGYVWNTLRRLGVADRELADLTQNVFLAVHKQLATYDAKRPLRLWLFGIAFRVMSNHRRAAQQRREVLAVVPEPADDAPSAEEQLDSRQKRKLVLDALAQLEDDRRVVLVMHDLDGHTMPDIAVELGVGLNTLYSRLRLGRADFLAAAAKLRRAGGDE